MIAGFGDSTTEDIYNGVDSKAARKMSKELWPAARRKLDMIDAVHDIRDLTAPPNNRLEKLKGAMKDRFSIRVNDQFRITFVWTKRNAQDVTIEDYH